MAGKVRRSALDSHVLPICSLPLQFVSLNGNKYLNYINDLISRAKKALPCGEGLGVGVVAVARGTCLTTTPTRLASLATLPTRRGRVRTEFAARGDGNSRDDVPALRRHAPRSPGGPAAPSPASKIAAAVILP